MDDIYKDSAKGGCPDADEGATHGDGRYDVYALARSVSNIYEDFTASVQALGAKGRKASKMGGSLLRWVGGSHVTTDREQLCEKFLADMEERLGLIESLIADESRKVRSQIADILAEIMMEPRPDKSNATTDLMKRAMIGHMEPFLELMSDECIKRQMERMDNAYGRWGRLPVEKNIYSKMKALI